MTIHIQNRDTKLFLHSNGHWTEDVEEAAQFQTSLDALKFTQLEKTKGAQIVLRISSNRKYDMVLEVSAT